MPQVVMDNCIHTVPAGTPLSELLPGHIHPCGGKGVCGKCKVRVRGDLSPLTPQEQRLLTTLEIADGIRLACCAAILGDCRVEAPGAASIAVCTEGESHFASVRPTFARYGASVDVGTTTLAARLYASDGALLAEWGAPNPQAAFGADVLTRVERALQGDGPAITGVIRDGVNRLLTDLMASAQLPTSYLDEIVVTGNTVMLTLLIGGDVAPFATAPFTGHSRFGTTLAGRDVGLTDCPDVAVYLAPCASAFLGGDLSTALLAAELPDKTVLLDIGTNGEMVLRVGDALYACSTAAGPAFEGVGISCGMVAAPGAVDRVELASGGLHPHVLGGGTATGICGSGLVDALACLQLLGDTDGPVTLSPGVTLTTEDIHSLLVSKSAIRSGLDTLLHTAGLSPDAVSSLLVAGGFGSYLNIHNATCIGLLPSVAVIRPVGNAALDGAARLLLDPSLRKPLAQRVAAVREVDLATNPYFARRFVENMTLEVPR